MGIDKQNATVSRRGKLMSVSPNAKVTDSGFERNPNLAGSASPLFGSVPG
jgi:hypothetical protein